MQINNSQFRIKLAWCQIVDTVKHNLLLHVMFTCDVTQNFMGKKYIGVFFAKKFLMKINCIYMHH